MTVKVHKWGNSSAVPVPAFVKEKLGIKNGSEVEIEVTNDAMIVKLVEDNREEIDPTFVKFLEENSSKYETVYKNLVDR